MRQTFVLIVQSKELEAVFSGSFWRCFTGNFSGYV